MVATKRKFQNVTSSSQKILSRIQMECSKLTRFFRFSKYLVKNLKTTLDSTADTELGPAPKYAYAVRTLRRA